MLHAAAGGAGANFANTPNAVSRRARTECEIKIDGSAEDDTGDSTHLWARMLKGVFDVDVDMLI